MWRDFLSGLNLIDRLNCVGVTDILRIEKRVLVLSGLIQHFKPNTVRILLVRLLWFCYFRLNFVDDSLVIFMTQVLNGLLDKLFEFWT